MLNRGVRLAPFPSAATLQVIPGVARRTPDGRNATLERGLTFFGYPNEKTYFRIFLENATEWVRRCIVNTRFAKPPGR